MYQVEKKKKSDLIEVCVNSASVDISDMSPQGNPIPKKEIESAANEAQLFIVLFKRQAVLKHSPRFVVSSVLASHAVFTCCSTLPFRNK